MSADPFKGRVIPPPPPMRVLHRFTKPNGHWAEIRERTVTLFRAMEFLVFVNGSLLESQMFHGKRAEEYPTELRARIKQLIDAGWSEQLSKSSPN